MTMSHPQDSRSGLAISFLGKAEGSSSSNLAASSSSSPKGSHRSLGSPRLHPPSSSSSRLPHRAFGSAFNDDDDDDDEDDSTHQEQSNRSNGHSSRIEVTGYSRSGAERAKRSPSPQGPRVIPLVGGSDWRSDRKRRLGIENLRQLGSLTSMRAGTKDIGEVAPPPPPRDSQLHLGEAKGVDQMNNEKQKSGLQIRDEKAKRTKEEEEEELKRLMMNAQDKTPPLDQAEPSPPRPTTSKTLSEDEQARSALLSGQTSLGTSLNSERTIALQSQVPSTLTEEEAFKYDADSRPDAPTLEDYAATPVEEFGKALLRGMGWKEGMGAGKGGSGPSAPPEVKKRSALLGLGAKERPGAIGASGSTVTGGKKDMRTKRPDARGYKPLVRRENGEEDRRGYSRSGSTSRRSHSPTDRERRREEESSSSRRSTHSSRRDRDNDSDTFRSRRDDDDDHRRSRKERDGHDVRYDDRRRERHRERESR